VLKTDLSDTDRHRLLGDAYRRAVLEVVSERAGSIGLEALVTEIDDRVDPTGTEHSSEQELRILLHHKHLPMVASKGIFDYDRDRCCVVL
jgi:hypothetical protein